jgi:hypothetical protein
MPDDEVGLLVVPGVEYFKCQGCGDLLFPLATVTKIGDIRDQKLAEILMSRPISEFIGSAEAAKILGMSRHAFSRNRRINCGFIFHVMFDEKKAYLRRSVLSFKKTGDGRFLLNPHLSDHPQRRGSDRPSKTRRKNAGAARRRD